MSQLHIIHGGDIYRQKIKIDFSVNVNPYGMPQAVKNALLSSVQNCAHYPDYTCENLINALSEKTELEKEQILCGNGASDLFMGIVHAIKPKKAMVFAPSFYGYTYALQAVSSEIQYEFLTEENKFQIVEENIDRIPKDIDLLFLCVPNNPTGSVIKKELLLKIFRHCKKNHIYVVCDTCFLEFTEQYEELKGEQFLKDFENLLVVNAFTKTYAIPGVRLGYVYGAPEMIKEIKKHLAEWNVSIPAMAAGMAALWVEKNTDYLYKTRKLLKQERVYLMQELQNAGIICYPSETDFLLLKSKRNLYDELLHQGILIRHCDNYAGLSEDYYRIAVKKHEENEILIQMLKR